MNTDEERKQERAQVLKTMENDLRWLLTKNPQDGLQWTGTQRDAVELVHEVWLCGSIYDYQGRVRRFKELLASVCRIVHLKPPKNPTATLDAIAHRKDAESLQLRKRYGQLMKESQERPLLRFLKVA